MLYDIKSYYVAMRTKLVRIASIAIVARRESPVRFNLTENPIKLLCDCGASQQRAGFRHARNSQLALCNLFASAFGGLCAFYYVEIYRRPYVRLLYKLIPDNVCILTTTLTLSIRPAVCCGLRQIGQYGA